MMQAMSAQKLLMVVNQALAMEDFTPSDKLAVVGAVLRHINYFPGNPGYPDETEAVRTPPDVPGLGWDVPTPAPAWGGVTGGQ
jgi:hypothetical protein